VIFSFLLSLGVRFNWQKCTPSLKQGELSGMVNHLNGWGWLIVLLMLPACQPAQATPALSKVENLIPVQVSQSALTPPAACADTFVTHPLAYTTTVRSHPVRLFESNGSGVAIGDLNDDGWPDVVFANLGGPNTILWNQGGLTFRPEVLDDTDSRAVNIVDVDGDNRLDLVFTHRTAGVSYWRNTGQTGFVRETLPGVLQPAYAMAWGDLNGDNRLDLVTGSYDAELNQVPGNLFLFSGGAGIYYYEQQAGKFSPHRLAKEAQSLAIILPDLNADGRPDILVGNDFDMPDAAWVREGDGWTATKPFATTSHSTMSYDMGDTDNNGSLEIVSTDMKPYDLAVPTLASWLPVMATMPEIHAPDDPQVMDNVLQVRQSSGQFSNEARSRGLVATGWSWSAKFGDLDNDGFLDFYTVNGMIAYELFHHLPGDELVEQNQALRNLGNGVFAPASSWNLGSTASGRGMSMADLDNDGDLDIVVNNLQSQARLFENQLCGGRSLQVELAWPESGNTRALGSQLVLHTSSGRLTRDVRAGSGYLSGDPARVHFGFPAEAALQRLDIHWPDGAVSQLDNLAPQKLLTIKR
jgi:hypothetical protein